MTFWPRIEYTVVEIIFWTRIERILTDKIVLATDTHELTRTFNYLKLAGTTEIGAASEK